MRPFLERGQRVEIDDGGGDGEEGAIEAVEHAAVAGEDIAAVLDAELAFEEALDEVAPRAKDANDEGEAQPLEEREVGGGREAVPQEGADAKAENATTYAAYPRLLGRDALEEFGGETLAQEATHAIGARIVGPEEDEEGEGVLPRVIPLVGHGIVGEGQQIEQAEGQGHIEVGGKGVGPTLERVVVAEIEFADEQEEHGDEQGREGDQRMAAAEGRARVGEDEEEIDATGGVDQPIDVCSRLLIDNGGELPNGEARDGGEEEDEGEGAGDDAADHNDDEECACYAALD